MLAHEIQRLTIEVNSKKELENNDNQELKKEIENLKQKIMKFC